MQDDSNKWVYWAVPALVVLGIVLALYFNRSDQAPEPEPVAVEPAPAVPAGPPPIQNPVEPAPTPEPLPTLQASDSPLQEALGAAFGRALEPFLVRENIIRRAVVTVDNLTRQKINVTQWPVTPVGGELATEGEPEALTLSEANYARYDAFVKMVQSMDVAQVVSAYQRYYPLFQEAYQGLGYPDGYFNDRLVEVIDHLLATPEVSAPIRLTRPSVYYEFADPQLEALSVGQKTLIRIGPRNAAVVKQKLRELRQAVAAQSN